MTIQQQLAALVKDIPSDKIVQGLDVFIVGGAVRDTLLGLQAGDKDWVVVGSSPAEMNKRKFIPVGSQFPVFLHPYTKEEYALARTERKTGMGYKGFTFYTGKDVSLEQDLSRRDLTVNAIALDKNANLIDPFNGVVDIQAKTFRHVGKAFNEDPVRLLRLARFMARFTDFKVASETLLLAKDLVTAGEVDALVPERVWQEITKGLMAKHPGRMFDLLHSTKALERIMPSLNWQPDSMAEMLCAAQNNLPLASRYALLTIRSDDISKLSKAIRASNECKDYALILPNLLQLIQVLDVFDAEKIVDVLVRTDAIRKPQRFLDLLTALTCVAGNSIKSNMDFWHKAINAVNSVDSGAISKAAQGDTAKIKQDIYYARLQSIQLLKNSYI